MDTAHIWARSSTLLKASLKAGTAIARKLLPHTVPQFPRVSQLPPNLPVNALRLMVTRTTVALPSHRPGRVQGQGLNRGFLVSQDSPWTPHH